MTDDEIIVLAADFKSTSMSCGVMVDDFDAVGFARAILATAPESMSDAAPTFEQWIESVPPLTWERWGRREAAHAAWLAARKAETERGEGGE